MAIRAADDLEKESLRIYVCRDSAEYMEATKVLLEVEADVKEKFAAAQKERSGISLDDKYAGPSQIEQQNMKLARDQLRKAIFDMDGEELDEALEVCNSIEGFEDHKINRILLKRAQASQEEAFERKDTSTWPQEDRERYSDFILGAAHESRNIKHLKAAIRDADKLERDSMNIYVCRDSEAYMNATKVSVSKREACRRRRRRRRQHHHHRRRRRQHHHHHHHRHRPSQTPRRCSRSRRT